MEQDPAARMLPSLFVSHGSPTLPLDGGPACDFLRGLAASFERPRAIVCASAHWETVQPEVTSSVAPATIHDFHGFPPELYAMRYPAPGDPALAQRIVDLLQERGFSARAHPQRGLDHGAWVPLLLAYPAADIPVVQVSLQTAQGPAHHLRLGQALAPLRQDRVLVMGSGGATHNLRAIQWDAVGAPPQDDAREFDEWLAARVAQGDVGGLLRYREQGPHGARNHPTPEHFLPLLVALGAAGATEAGGNAARGVALHRSFTWGAMSMAAFAWGASAPR